MRYLEELKPGESFRFNHKVFILTCDFKSSGNRLCFCLEDGSPSWLPANSEVENEPIYILDQNNNILPIKKYDNQNFNIL